VLRGQLSVFVAVAALLALSRAVGAQERSPAALVASASKPPAALSDSLTGAAARHAPALRLALDSLLAAHGTLPGVTVGVAFADGSSIGLAAGFADTVRKTRMTVLHRLPQGSVGKTYVAAVALQLVRERKLVLEAPISRYLATEPWFSRLPNARAITVRQLMNHTSGVVRYEFQPAFTRALTAHPDRVWRPSELIAFVLDGQAPFPAGQGWDYSDTNYILLGMIVERLTGRAFYAELRRRILTPYGLRETVPQDSRSLRGVPQGYAGPDNPFGGRNEMLDSTGRMIINPQFEWTGGGVVSTARDLARWGRALFAGSVLDSGSRAEMLRGVPAPLGPPGTQYGLGVIIRPLALGTSYGHSGFFPGYSTELMYFPDDTLTVAVQVNSSDPRSLTPGPARVVGTMVRTIRAARASPRPE